VLLAPRDVTVPVGVPSWRTPEMQHFWMGLDAMIISDGVLGCVIRWIDCDDLWSCENVSESLFCTLPTSLLGFMKNASSFLSSAICPTLAESM
jgi:hypothetical protein